jgi:RNA polymerase subunit RPABC4/transcription elongation factor Spt4
MATRTHLTWSLENADNTCPFCGSTEILLVVAPADWEIDEEGRKLAAVDSLDIEAEVTAHVCNSCRRITSLSLNTLD